MSWGEGQGTDRSRRHPLTAPPLPQALESAVLLSGPTILAFACWAVVSGDTWSLDSDISLNRKCKLVTSGPWLEVAPIALGDVSIIPESADADGRGHSIALWAVSDKGDVLCRLGVSELNPAVSTSLLAFRGCPCFCSLVGTRILL